MLKFADIAKEIIDSESVTDYGASFLTAWFRNNLGALNATIQTEYVLDDTTLESTVDLGESEKAVFKKMFLVYYYGRKTRENLGAAGLQTVLEATSDGGTVRLVNKNEVAKTYAQLKKSEEQALADLIAAYSLSTLRPLGISGDDGEQLSSPIISYNDARVLTNDL